MTEPTKTPAQPAIPPELASLMAEAHALGGQPGEGMPPDAAPPAAPMPVSLAQANRDTIAMALQGGRDTAIAIGKIKSLEALKNSDCDKVADLWAEVLARRGINLQAHMGSHLDIIMAAWTTYQILAPIIRATVAEYQQKRGAALAESAQPATEKVAPAA